MPRGRRAYVVVCLLRCDLTPGEGGIERRTRPPLRMCTRARLRRRRRDGPCAYVSAMFICSIASRVATRVVMWCSRRLVARPASCFEIRATYAACAGSRAGQPAQARARVRFTSYTGHLRRVPRSTALQVQACGARASWCAIAHKHCVRGARRSFAGVSVVIYRSLGGTRRLGGGHGARCAMRDA